MAPNNPNKKGMYFAPGEVMLLYEHDAALTPEQLAETAQANLSEFLVILQEKYPEISEYLLSEITLDAGRIITQATTADANNRTSSFVFVAFTIDATASFDAAEFSVPEANQRMAAVINAAYATLQALDGSFSIGESGIALLNVSPNWLLTSSQPVFTGTGGPGAKPVPPAVFDPQNPPYKFTIDSAADPGNYVQDYLRTLMGCPPSAAVEVAILDTVPPSDCPTLKATFPNHPIIQQLCSNNTLQIHRYDTHVAPLKSTMQQLSGNNKGIGIEQHDYDMADHGLFAAGIINTIAPNARLHLIEVLNRYGVGTSETIANGINYALQQAQNSALPLVVNLSLTINMPLPHRRRKPQHGPEREYHEHSRPNLESWTALKNNETFVQYLTAAIQALFAPLINNTDILVVAAAGNDGKANQARPQSRLPAQLPGVTGVGALMNGSDQATPYTNVADKPEDDGIATLGGDVDAAAGGAKTDSANGILGVYTGAFPDGGDASATAGWARWAGTSFATPVIAGMLALLCADGKTAAQALQTIRDAKAEPTGKTHVFLVNQR